MNATPAPLTDAQLLAALRWRYATKGFDPARKIPPATWSALEDSLVLSSSSFGLQPYRFLVIQNPELRAQLLPHAWGQKQIVDASHLVIFAARTGVTEAEIDALLRITADTRGTSIESMAGYRGMMTGMLLTDGFKDYAPHWAAHQAYLALGGLLESAAVLGIDACPIEGFVPAEFNRILDLPDQGLHAVVACALGYRSSGDKYATAPKVRFPKSHLIRTL